MNRTSTATYAAASLLCALSAVAKDAPPESFEQEISCLQQRIPMVRIVGREPLFLEGDQCGHLYTVEVVNAWRGQPGKFAVF